MSARPDYSLLVSSCDAYSDCWPPFFTLLQKYWRGLNAPIVLSSETKGYSHSSFEIECPCTGRNVIGPIPWARLIRQTLEVVKTDYVLILLEDFFLQAPVRESRFQEILRCTVATKLAHVLLTDAPEPNQPSPFPGLVVRGRRAPYRLSLQAGLWRTDFLLGQLRDHESSWQFETWGSIRSRRSREELYAVESAEFHSLPVFDYPMTGGGGLIRGRWKRDNVESLFLREGIVIDYSVRGFSEPEKSVPRQSGFRYLCRKAWHAWRSLRP